MQTIDLHMPDTVRAFSTMRGPLANDTDPYSGFSLCHYTGDSPAHISRCLSELCTSTGLPPQNIIIPRQTHSDRVAIIDRIPACETLIENVDALVSSLSGVALCINTADCVPVTLADSQAGVIAAAHCGWRGIVNQLLPNTIAAMRRLGAEPARIHAAMGPSICAGCFEVGQEVADIFSSTFPEASDIVIDNIGDKPHIDLGAAITARLRQAGIKPANITRPRACSRCAPHTYFSARAAGINSGRILSIIIKG